MSEKPREKLEQFRAKCEARVVKYWTTPGELGGQVAKSLIQIRNTHPAEGWVRASGAVTPELERELAELRARVAELTNELEHSRQNVADVPSDIARDDDLYAFNLYLFYYTSEQVKKGKFFGTRIRLRTSTRLKLRGTRYSLTLHPSCWTRFPTTP